MKKVHFTGADPGYIDRGVGFVIPPANFVCGGYTVFTLSVRVSVHPSVRP